MFYIYKIIFPNEKIYIGKSKDYLKRFDDHLYVARKQKRNTLLYNALRKYSEETIILTVIDYTNFLFEASEKEIYWIDKLKSTNFNIGYNMTPGGDGGNTWLKIDEERKSAISKKRSELWKTKNPGTLWKNETREKISSSVKKYMNNRSKEEVEEYLKILSDSVQKYYASENGMKRKMLMRGKFSGDKSPVSLISSSKRHNCSLEEARKYTSMYGKHQNDYAKEVASRTHKGKTVSLDTR